MGLTRRLQGVAFATPLAFPVLGAGGEGAWRDLVSSGAATRSPSPRNADILLLAGLIPPSWNQPLRDLFETFALPRAVVWLRPSGFNRSTIGLPALMLDAWDEEAVAHALLDPASEAWRPLHDDVPPAPWRGEGDHGQGGKGMMGGKPYGRPMAMTMMDPDGLKLGDLPTGLGPFFPNLPSGLRLTLRLQGARLRLCEEAGFLEADVAAEALIAAGASIAPFLRAAAGETVPVRALETARLEHHLGRIADLLELSGLSALARRALQAARAAEMSGIPKLLSDIGHSGAEARLGGFGRLGRPMVERNGIAGLAARACGVPDDMRSACPAYRDLGFEPLVEADGDCAARLRLLLRECRQSLDLVRRSGERTSAAEGPAGPLSQDGGRWRTPTASLLIHLPMLLGGLTVDEAVTTIASLCLSTEEAMLA